MGFTLTVYRNASEGSHVLYYRVTYVTDLGASGTQYCYPGQSSGTMSNLATASITAVFDTNYSFSRFQYTTAGVPNAGTYTSYQNGFSYSASAGTLQIWAAESYSPAPPPETGFTLTVYYNAEQGAHVSRYYISYVNSNGVSSSVNFYPSSSNTSYSIYNLLTVSVTAYFSPTSYEFTRFQYTINGSTTASSYQNPTSYSASSGTFELWAAERYIASTFKITGYADDPGISSFSAYDTTTYSTYTFPYTASSSGLPYSGLPKNSFVFGAVLNGSTTASGDTLIFKRWAYRVGDASATEQYNYNQSFTYNAGNYTNADIYIRPETNFSDWSLKPYNATAGTTYSVSVGKYQLFRFAISFSTAKQITFSATNNTGKTLLGYLSTSTSYNASTGVPTSTLTSKSGTTITISYSVSANTTYYFYIRTYTATTAAGSTTVLIGGPKPEPWSWTANQNRTNAYNALVNHTATTNFVTSVWNDLCDKVNEVLVYVDLTWSTTYASLANTKFSGTNKTLTAVKFNSLRSNIDRLRSTGIGTKAAGDTVMGSYFTTLTSTLNQYINTL